MSMKNQLVKVLPLISASIASLALSGAAIAGTDRDSSTEIAPTLPSNEDSIVNISEYVDANPFMLSSDDQSVIELASDDDDDGGSSGGTVAMGVRG